MHGDLTLRSLVRCSADQTISSCPDILAPPSLASSSSHGIHMSLTLLVSLVSFLSSPTDGHAGVVSPRLPRPSGFRSSPDAGDDAGYEPATNLSNRLNPNNIHFDAELANR